MDLSLVRRQANSDGVISDLCSPNIRIATTLEHAFGDNLVYAPKVKPGTYKCVRGTHQLDHGGKFETFEITGVVGHSGILFHVGNYNSDSDGCVLLGSEVLNTSQGHMVVNSRVTFAKFMELQKDVNEFILVVL